MVSDARLCMIESTLILAGNVSTITRSLGKPSHPEDRPHRLSLNVDRLPALFADTVEYLHTDPTDK